MGVLVMHRLMEVASWTACSTALVTSEVKVFKVGEIQSICSLLVTVRELRVTPARWSWLFASVPVELVRSGCIFSLEVVIFIHVAPRLVQVRIKTSARHFVGGKSFLHDDNILARTRSCIRVFESGLRSSVHRNHSRQRRLPRGSTS